MAAWLLAMAAATAAIAACKGDKATAPPANEFEGTWIGAVSGAVIDATMQLAGQHVDGPGGIRGAGAGCGEAALNVTGTYTPPDVSLTFTYRVPGEPKVGFQNTMTFRGTVRDGVMYGRLTRDNNPSEPIAFVRH